MARRKHNFGSFKRNLLMDRDNFCSRRANGVSEPPVGGSGAEVGPPRGARLKRGDREFPSRNWRYVESTALLSDADLGKRFIGESVLAADEPV